MKLMRPMTVAGASARDTSSTVTSNVAEGGRAIRSRYVADPVIVPADAVPIVSAASRAADTLEMRR